MKDELFHSVKSNAVTYYIPFLSRNEKNVSGRQKIAGV
jgi:hypothetical protein